MVRFHIKSYNFHSISSRLFFISSGNLKVEPAGLMASCASCAFLTLLLYVLGLSGKNSSPNLFFMILRLAVIASFERLTESVRM